MKLEGGCYCKAVRFVCEGEPIVRGECFCRECQHISGGGPNIFMLMPKDGFAYVHGAPKQFKRADLETPVTREFCGECGAPLTTLLPGRPFIVVKVGALDDPALFGDAQIAIHCADMQPFHHAPEGARTFDRVPPH